MNKKGFLDISFSWIFALIIGAVIIFGAISFVHRVSDIKSSQNSAEAGTSLVNLLNPLQTVLESSKSITISLPVESKINHFCSTAGNFGQDTFSIQEYLNKKWTNAGVGISTENKYIFTPSVLQSKELYVFSEPFKFPYPVANLMYFSDAQSKYCFVSAPPKIESNLKDLNQSNFEFDNCSVGSTKICFGGQNCDINVNLDQKTVTKNGNTMYFDGDALMYGAIFSDKKTYDCEIVRLQKRTKALLSVYTDKSNNLQKIGCDSSLSADFSTFNSELSSFNDTSEIFGIFKTVNDINSINQNSGCQLW